MCTFLILNTLQEENVFKLVGPILMAVELMEAKGHVSNRLELIEGEVKKVEGAIGGLILVNVTLILNIKYAQVCNSIILHFYVSPCLVYINSC